MAHRDRVARNAYHAKYQRELFARLRAETFEKLGGAYCKDCGCSDSRILEINHIKGGGYQERTKWRGVRWLKNILKDRDRKRKYNVLCKVCNAKHYVYKVLGIRGHKVTYKV